MAEIEVRPVPESVTRLQQQGISPLLARIFAARGVQDGAELETRLNRLVPSQQLRNIEAMARRLADAIAAQQTLTVIADYDADGATACACAVRGLRAMGAQVNYLVPNRFEYGYGLTPEIVDLAHQLQPDVLITVDNGIASLEGVERAQALGLEVLITDHHLPGERLPRALIVNPNQPDCPFPSKHLAGVGVMFYVLMALRAEGRRRGWFQSRPEPNLADLLDLVALGTVADVVKLDRNNRLLVHHGLARMRAGRLSPGLMALFQVAKRDWRSATSHDLGFSLGPRLNAAGRLDDMSLGIRCLMTTSSDEAMQLAQELDTLNRERREIETGMQEEALASLPARIDPQRYTLALFDENWHQGVIGIVASRLKERFHRPVITFAPGDAGWLKGSGRSIPGLHLKDALEAVQRQHPGLIHRFGGHAMAAGLTLAREAFATFCEAFEHTARTLMSADMLTRRWETDGELAPEDLMLDNARWIETQVWGQGFPPPCFHGQFRVVEQKTVGNKHRRLTLQYANRQVEAMLFFHEDPLPDFIDAIYQLSVNRFMGQVRLQLILQKWEASHRDD